MGYIVNKKTILILFFASGISGLIYEVVWLRMLSRIVSVTTYATSITLAAFMAGMAIGSYLLGRLADRRKDLLKVFSILQFLVAVTAVLTPVIFKLSLYFYGYIFNISNQNTELIFVLRILVSFFSLLLPTVVMGGTLPVLAAYLVRKEKIFGKNFSLPGYSRWTGSLYPRKKGSTGRQNPEMRRKKW